RSRSRRPLSAADRAGRRAAAAERLLADGRTGLITGGHGARPGRSTTCRLGDNGLRSRHSAPRKALPRQRTATPRHRRDVDVTRSGPRRRAPVEEDSILQGSTEPTTSDVDEYSISAARSDLVQGAFAEHAGKLT